MSKATSKTKFNYNRRISEQEEPDRMCQGELGQINSPIKNEKLARVYPVFAVFS